MLGQVSKFAPRLMLQLLALIEQKIDACSVLITDIRLARNSLTGWDIAHLARELNPTIFVVYITGDSALEWALRGVPGSILIQKPFDPREVVSAVSHLLGLTNSAHHR